MGIGLKGKGERGLLGHGAEGASVTNLVYLPGKSFNYKICLVMALS